jgi:5'-nucleotidase
MRPLILLTNDDGIDSPGLWSAARALASLGEVVVAAPRQQYSGAGRSLPSFSDGIIEVRTIELDGRPWKAYAVGGSPAQAVLHGILEILPRHPDLVVVGINYGENVGSGVTISGTVGAALQAAAMGARALAISLETDVAHHHSISEKVDFSVAATFTLRFSQMILHGEFPADVHLLKVDIPANATPTTPWRVTRQSLTTYFIASAPRRTAWDKPEHIGYELSVDLEKEPPDTDVYALRAQRMISITPLSLDLTSRVDPGELERNLHSLEANL